MHKEKVALLFFGLTRGLKYTLEQIKNNVIEPLNKNYDVDIFIHTYFFTGKYKNPRHGIENLKLDFEEYKLLEPKYYAIDDQNKVAGKLNLKSYRSKPDIFQNNYKSNDNYILSLYSIQEVFKLFNKYKKDYKYAMFIRPDVLFIEKFNIKWLNNLDKNSILIPGWDCFNKFVETNLNNRFAVTRSEDAHKYGELLKELLVYSKNNSIMAEEFLGKMLFNFYKMTVIKIDFRFQRVLPDGSILWRDEDIRKKK